ncbi:MAG: hypothetical protein NTY02_16545, partial [Acidobacteria bacterium]|nr:hypothetical protein [Acidobacteriota bacterium]
MRAVAVVLCAWSVLAPDLVVAQRDQPLPFSAADADHFAQKLSRIVLNAETLPPGDRGRARTIVTEPEVNAYLRYRAQAQLPAGVIEPYVQAVGGGRVVGVATVDLDAVRESQKRGWLDPMRLLRGRLPVNATGILHARDGVAQFELESASAGGVPIPKSLLQELVAYYSRTPAHPEGLGLDAPFELPAGIREISVEA